MPDEVETLVLAGRIDRLLTLAASARHIGERRYLADAIERALLYADPGAIRPEWRGKASGLGVDPAIANAEDPPAPPHAVLVPFVPSDGGPGFVRMIYIAWDPTGADAHDGLAAEARQAVQQAMDAATAHASPGSRTAGYRLAAAQPRVLSAMQIEGRSVGAAAFVSAVALWSGRRVLPGTLVTGDLTPRGIAAVGGLAAKLEGALEGRADVHRIVVPSRNATKVRNAIARAGRDLEVVGVGSHEALMRATLSEQAAVRPEDAVVRARAVFTRGWEGYRWPTQREPLARLAGEIPTRRPDLRVEVLTMLGAVTRHLGAPDQSLEILREAEAILDTDDGLDAVPDGPITVLHQHLALTLRQMSRFEEAARTARRAISVARKARLRGELLKALGCAGLVALSRNRAAEAVTHQSAALDLVHRHRPEGCPRTHAYLIEALGRGARLDDARREYQTALRHLRALPEGPRRDSQEAWLRTAWAGVCCEDGQMKAARRVLDADCVRRAIADDPLPGLLARRWSGIALCTGRNRDAGLGMLADSPVAYGRLHMPHVFFLAHLNVLFEARERIRLHAWNADIASRVATALTHLPGYGETPGFLHPPGRAVGRLALAARPDHRKLDRALAALLKRCTRLA